MADEYRSKVIVVEKASDAPLGNSKKDEEKKWEEYYAARLKHHKKFLKDVEKAEAAARRDTERAQKEIYNLTLKERAEYWREQQKSAENFNQKLKTGLKAAGYEFGENLKDAASKAYSNITKGAERSVQSYIDIYDKYMSSVEARIQGTGKSFESFTRTIQTAIGSSQYVSQTKVLEKLASLVDQGIAYNIEQRAFLGTISEKIATTFNVANGTLLQLIRIQQADSTVARLGIEASITQFLNSMYMDTSYLNETYKTVSAALLETSAQRSREESVEFEYVVQKWLGSLGSVGVSASTLSTLAQGINYLSTGNITALSSNEALQRLLVTASARSGVGYATSLTGGLTTQDANRLLQGIVEVGQEIARSSNQVVKSQYAQLFGMTISDLTALLNLSSKDLVDISKNMLTYSDTIQEVSNQLEAVPGRMHLSERINNLISNTMASVGANIANSAGLYATWTIANLVEKATGGIGIPSVLGSSLNNTVEGLMKAAIIGTNVLGQIPSIISGLTGKSGLSLANWGAAETLSRGSGLVGIETGKREETSMQTFIGDTSKDIAASTVAKAKDELKEDIAGTETDTSLELLKEIYKILDRVSNYGGDAFRVDTEEGGYTVTGTRQGYLEQFNL